MVKIPGISSFTQTVKNHPKRSMALAGALAVIGLVGLVVSGTAHHLTWAHKNAYLS